MSSAMVMDRNYLLQLKYYLCLLELFFQPEIVTFSESVLNLLSSNEGAVM